jgi:hypothetical protein
MTHINFDGVARRDAKEPQITKTQLLEPIHHTTSGTGWDTPRSIYGVGNPVANDASWGFGALDALDTTETPSDSPNAPVKQEPATPAPDLAHYTSDDEDNQTTARKQNGDSHGTMGRRISGSSPEDKFGHKSGVIDLTGDDSDDDEQDLTMPERRFVPRAELDNAASSFPRQKSPSPPRTFTKGLEPIAAHPRKPPIVHRQKPPIKPVGRQRKTTSASPSPAVAASQEIFTKRRRLLSVQAIDLHLPSTPDRSSSTVRSLECTPLGYSTDSMDQTPGREVNPLEGTDATKETTPTASAPKNSSGPFFEDDDSSDDAGKKAAPPKKKYSRDSMTRLLDRPRNNTPIRSAYDVMVEESRAMRARAHQRAQEDLATRGNTVAPGADNADVDMIDEQAFLGLPHRRGMQ